jgi:protein-disulfide isomerase
MDVIIRVFGPSPPCAKCQAAEKVAREVAQKLGEVTVEKCDIFSEEAEKYNIMMTPTVMVNNIVLEVGKVPSAEKLERAVRDALNSQNP